jgi:integrase
MTSSVLPSRKREPVRTLVPASCSFCGEDLGVRERNESGLHFCLGHNAKYESKLRDKARLGPFLKVYEIYKQFAFEHYRDTKHPLDVVRNFLSMLKDENLRSINSVTIDHIGMFKAAYQGQRGRADFLKVFFDFLIRKKIYRKWNPVQPDLHYEKEWRDTPRIYDDHDVADMIKWAEERGDTRANLILASGLEFGPKENEVLSIRVKDVDRDLKRIWFRRANPRPGEEQYSHFAPYWSRTEYWLEEWLRERPKIPGNDYLLINERGEPLKKDPFRRLLNGVFAKHYQPQKNARGFESFSFRRLRDTNVFLLRRAGMKDSVNMRMHGMKAVASIKRFDRLFTQKELNAFHRAID